MKDFNTLGEGWCWDDDNPVLSPLLFGRKDQFMERFERDLRESGIVVDAFSATGQKPENAFCICRRFHTIDQVLMRMMKESNNLFAESMFYQIAASTGSHPATADDARNVIRRLISKIGLDPSRYKIADGSGLSLYNYVSAELLVKMLRYASQNGNIYLHLQPSLPSAGMDGTLKSRMKGSFTHGNVYAKTGTVTGISSLAGYCTASNGHKLCFAIINQSVMHGSNARAFQDKVCTALCSPQ
jgi:D-alanyl-D-alanine carboxypeptidase/D-alanyl-D-alanine-endopeptidase (penicillin-binding protein 4)